MSSRRALQTIQAAPKLEEVAKMHKDNARVIANESVENKENAGGLLAAKATANLNVSGSKAVTAAKPSNTANRDSGVRLMTDKEPSEDYWKIIAEQRRKALEITLEENEQVFEEVCDLYSAVVAMNKTLEAKNKIIATQNEKLESQAAEIIKLRKLAVEVERLSGILEELTADLDEFNKQ